MCYISCYIPLGLCVFVVYLIVEYGSLISDGFSVYCWCSCSDSLCSACLLSSLRHTHTHTLTWFRPNSHEFRALFQFSELGPSCANKVCYLVWFFLHLCVTWYSVPMSPFKKAAIKGGNSKGKEHVIDVDDLSPRLKRNRSSSGVYDPNKFRTYAAFQTHEKYFKDAKLLLERALD